MIGQHITFTADSGIYKDTYKSRILDIKDNMMIIAIPYHMGAVVLPGVGTRLSINVETSGYSFDCEILERNIIKKYLKVSTPDSISRNSSTRLKKLTKVIAVTSGKGGVGKTSLAINFAIALAELDKNVLVFDADLGMANVDVLLNLKPEYDILDVITGDKKVKDVIVNGPKGIRFIPGASGLQQLAYLSDAQFNNIISGFNEIEGEYDYMLIDTGAGLSRNVTDFLLASDEIFLVTTTEPHAIMDAYSIVKVMTDLKSDKNISLVVNRCESPGEALSVANKMQITGRRFLNVEINYLGYILEDKNVSRSIKAQSPLLVHSPEAPASRCIRGIAKTCSGEVAQKNSQGGIVGFLNKLKKFF